MSSASPDSADEPGDYDNSLGMPLLKHIIKDQQLIWISPARVRLEDTIWLVPLGGLTTGLTATETDVSRHLSNSASRGYVREYQYAPSAPALPLSARLAIWQAQLVRVVQPDQPLPPVPPGNPFASISQVDLLNGYVGMQFENWAITFGKMGVRSPDILNLIVFVFGLAVWVVAFVSVIRLGVGSLLGNRSEKRRRKQVAHKR